MQRVMVIGCCGAGKSVFSRRLQKRLSLPLIHLDRYYWNAGWEPTETDAWRTRVRKLAAAGQWIIDGNYRSTMDIRLKRADTIIFLDTPRWICLYRVIKRLISYFGRSRPDMAEGCYERLDVDFLRYVYHFHRRHRPVILEKLEQLPPGKSVVILRKKQDAEQFLKRTSLASSDKFL